MLNYIKSFFNSPEPELSLQESLEILGASELCAPAPASKKIQNPTRNGTECSVTKTGKITSRQNDTYTIDTLYEFAADGDEYQVGETVTYRKTICDGEILIYNILKVHDVWDQLTTFTTTSSSSCGTRIIVCKVQKRERRILQLSPDNISINLDKITIDFIPIEGDWLELDIQYEIDTDNFSSPEHIVKIRKISPVRPHIVTGLITYWNVQKRLGYIDKQIFFNEDALICGYLPKNGDQVVCEVIESDQGQSVWRALKITYNKSTVETAKDKPIIANIDNENQSNNNIDVKPAQNGRRFNNRYSRWRNRNESWEGFKQELPVIRGQSTNKVRFIGKYLPNYTLPRDLLELIENSKKEDAINELQRINGSLIDDLTAFNYEEKFYLLLYLSEIRNLIAMKQYDKERACFIRNGEFLMLEIENLAERRPSIVIGDRIKVGDPRGILKQYYEGNVCKVTAKHVYLRFSAWFHDRYNDEDYAITVIPGRSHYRRQHHAVFLACKNLGNRWLFPSNVVEASSVQVTFTYDQYDSKIDPPPSNCPLKLEWYNKKLNCKQKDAVVNILKGCTRPMPYIIYGPPGTGKTVTLIESVLQVLRFIVGGRILVAAPSNSAADLIALRLIASGVLRPGDLVRLVSINYSISDQIDPELVPYCAICSGAKEGTMKEDVKDEKGIMHHYSQSSLGRHKITVSTCSTAGSMYTMGFTVGHFSHIFVDEAGQASEPEVLIPISFLDKATGQVILAGDPMQLGPIVTCPIASEYGLSESFLERVQNRFPYIRDTEGFPETEGYDCRLVTKLLYNYRSLGDILNLFSTLFYNGDLIATVSDTDSEESNLLKNLSSILPKGKNGTVPSIVFHGIKGENYQSDDCPSWYNPHEAAQVFFYINELYRLGVSSSDIGIITPYIKQVREIRHLLEESEFDLPKIGTVEDFQGQEFKIILISTVRSSSNLLPHDYQYSLGFISMPRRVNVAISRARALLIIIGNPQLLYHDSYWRNIIDFCRENGACIGCDTI